MAAKKIEPLRILISVLVATSLGLAFSYHYRYQLKRKELAQYQQLGRYSSEALRSVNTELLHSRKRTNELTEELARVNEVLAALEKDNLAFKEELRVLKEENASLMVKVTQLAEEKTALEENFHSLEKLKQAIKIAREEKRLRDKIAWIQTRLAQIRMQQSLDEVASRLGNRGYIVRDGYSTYRPRIRVEIEPLGP